MQHILVTNDDGYKSAGYYPLLEELNKNYKVTAVAPSGERSWIGKSMSAHNPVRFETVRHENLDVTVIDGTPADCVQIGLYSIAQTRPDFVVSGINIGSNTGHGRILSSGTIGAAMEGAIDGVVSVAVSLCDTKGRDIDYFDPSSYIHFKTAAKIVTRVIDLLQEVKLPHGIDVISVNIPFDAKEDTAIEITKPHRNPYGKVFTRQGEDFVHSHLPEKYENLENGTDLKAVHEGRVAVTPIDLSLANSTAIEFLNQNLKAKWSTSQSHTSAQSG